MWYFPSLLYVSLSPSPSTPLSSLNKGQLNHPKQSHCWEPKRQNFNYHVLNSPVLYNFGSLRVADRSIYYVSVSLVTELQGIFFLLFCSSFFRVCFLFCLQENRIGLYSYSLIKTILNNFFSSLLPKKGQLLSSLIPYKRLLNGLRGKDPFKSSSQIKGKRKCQIVKIKELIHCKFCDFSLLLYPWQKGYKDF